MSRLWGHKSRCCFYCGKVGPRVVIAQGWAHRRCMPKAKYTRAQITFLETLNLSAHGTKTHMEMGFPARPMPRKLERAGLIVIGYIDSCVRTYSITQAGRALVAAGR